MSWEVDLRFLLEVGGLLMVAGMAYQNIKTLRRDVDELRAEVKDFRELRADVAVVKAEVRAIHEQLGKLDKVQAGIHSLMEKLNVD